MTLIAQPSIGDWAEWTQAIIVFLIALVAGYWALVRFRFPETDRPVLKTVIGGVAWSPNEEMLVIIFEVANDHRVPVELGPWSYAVFDVDVDPHPKAPDQPWLYQLRGEKWDRFVKHSPGNVVPAHSSVGFVYSVPMQNLGPAQHDAYGTSAIRAMATEAVGSLEAAHALESR